VAVSLRLALLERRTPCWLKRRLLDDLTRMTAEALGGSPPRWSTRAFDSRLQQYAAFSAGAAGRILAGGDQAAIEVARTCLRTSAADLGSSLRRRLGLRREDDVARALTLLYRHIGIDFRPAGPSEVEVTRCAFARVYDERVCRLMSALDEGVAAGLSAGWRLRFSERLTAGASCCRASFGPDRASGAA
jgi:hypothetical protein